MSSVLSDILIYIINIFFGPTVTNIVMYINEIKTKKLLIYKSSSLKITEINRYMLN